MRNLQGNPTGDKGKILVVDNEPDLATLLKEGLEYFGFEVDAYTNSDSALNNYKKNQYDLLLLDIKMGTSNGIGLLNEMIEEGRGKRKEKVCFITASNFTLGQYSFYHKEFDKITDKEIRENMKENPETHVIQKPIHIRELASKLYQAIKS